MPASKHSLRVVIVVYIDTCKEEPSLFWCGEDEAARKHGSSNTGLSSGSGPQRLALLVPLTDCQLHSPISSTAHTAHSKAKMVETNVKVYVACTSALYLKFLATVTIQSGKTFRSGGRPPEDSKLSLAKKFKVKQNYGMTVDEKDEKILKAREVELRWRRIVQNDLESIPLALFVFAGGILAGSNEKVHVAAMVLYTLSRYAHTVTYAKSMQPHRALFWFGGVLTTLVGVGNAVAAIL